MFQLLLGKNRLFNDWIMQEMVPHSLGGTTLLHKSVLPITMIFSVISFLRKVIKKTCSVLEAIQLLVKKCFSLLGQNLYT